MKSTKTPERKIPCGVVRGFVQDFLQHFAQPAASVQHFAHVAGSLQQLPSHLAAGLAHAVAMVETPRQTVLDLSRLLVGGCLVGGADEFQIFDRIFVEIRLAVFAAEFHFLVLVNEHKRFAHLAELVAGDRTGLEQIGHGIGGGVRSGRRSAAGGEFAGQRQQAREEKTGKRFFHVGIKVMVAGFVLNNLITPARAESFKHFS
jgi:hypothetical protein